LLVRFKTPMLQLLHLWIISIVLVIAAADSVVGHARPKHICEKADSSAAVVALSETTSTLQLTEHGLATFLTSLLYLIDKGNVLCSSHIVNSKLALQLTLLYNLCASCSCVPEKERGTPPSGQQAVDRLFHSQIL
jgi:hypothetical protein